MPGQTGTLSDLELPGLDAVDLVWDNPYDKTTDALDIPIDDVYGQRSFAEPSSPPWLAAHLMNEQAMPQQSMTCFGLSIPSVPKQPVRSLIQRPSLGASTSRVTSLMLSVLKSYPQMMLRDQTYPPFIHPSLISSGHDNDHMEPLHNCISLVHMMGSNIQGSRKLFWRNARMECEHMLQEHETLNKWGLLAAMQALSIYILIRVSEGETQYNSLDSLLLATITAVAKQFTRTDIILEIPSAESSSALGRKWKEWLLEESARRICIIYQVVNMLVYFEPAAMCNLQSDLVLAPLPAKRQLWEANDAVTWEIENAKSPTQQASFGLAANGELVRLQDEDVHCHDSMLRYESVHFGSTSSKNANWEEWCAGMDSFGGLIMLAASLVA